MTNLQKIIYNNNLREERNGATGTVRFKYKYIRSEIKKITIPLIVYTRLHIVLFKCFK